MRRVAVDSSTDSSDSSDDSAEEVEHREGATEDGPGCLLVDEKAAAAEVSEALNRRPYPHAYAVSVTSFSLLRTVQTWNARALRRRAMLRRMGRGYGNEGNAAVQAMPTAEGTAAGMPGQRSATIGTQAGTGGNVRFFATRRERKKTFYEKLHEEAKEEAEEKELCVETEEAKIEDRQVEEEEEARGARRQHEDELAAAKCGKRERRMQLEERRKRKESVEERTARF